MLSKFTIAVGIRQDSCHFFCFKPHSIVDCPPKNGSEKTVPETSDIVNLSTKNYKEKSMGRSNLTIEINCKHTHFTC